MKKALSIVLSVAMLMSVLFVSTVSAAPLTGPIIELMNPDFVVEGNENVTFNEDGTWTVKGNFALRCDVNYDLDIVQNIYQDLETNTPVKITIFDEIANKWIGLYDNWVGPSHFPAGTYAANNGIKGIYTWNKWDYTGGANVTAIYFEFDGATADTVMTLKNLYLNDGTLKPKEVYFGDAEYEYNTTYDLAVKDVDAWTCIPASGSQVVATVEGDTLSFGNTNAAWPSVFIDFDEPIVVDEETMVYCDFSVANKAKTTIYLFFGQATCTEFDNGAYAVLHNECGAEVEYGNYTGYVSLKDILPTDEAALAACYDAEGNLTVTGIKVFATSTSEEAVDPAVTIKALDLCYNVVEEDDTVIGDLTGDGQLNMLDVLNLYNGASGKVNLTDAQRAVADFNGDGNVNVMDSLALYNKVSGK